MTENDDVPGDVTVPPDRHLAWPVRVDVCSRGDVSERPDDGASGTIILPPAPISELSQNRQSPHGSSEDERI